LTIAGKAEKTDNDHPRKLAIGVFNTLGINEGKKLTKEQFIKGYYSIFLFSTNQFNLRCKKDSGLRELFGGGH
jgi:hypothetical protein